MLHVLVLNSPIGVVKTTYTEKGISTIDLNKNFNNQINLNDLKLSGSNITVLKHSNEKNHMQNLIEAWFRNYFSDEHIKNQVDIPVDNKMLSAENFTSKVLKNLKEVPFGSTVTYKELAEISGNSKSSRAVGQVMGKNPLPLLYPCHRVINSSGKIGNYMHGQGNNIKCWLINFEKRKLWKKNLGKL